MAKIDYFSNRGINTNLAEKTIKGGVFTIVIQAVLLVLNLMSLAILARAPKFPFIMRLPKRYRAMRLSMHFAKKVLCFLPIESCLISNHNISDKNQSIDLHRIFYEDAQKLGDLINVNLMEKWFKR